MTYWRVIPFCPHRLYSKRGGRQVAAPTVTLVGSTVQPHRLYSKRGGQLVADKRRCDCHRQSIVFDSLRGAPPLHSMPLRLWRTSVLVHPAQKRMSKFGKKHLTNVWPCGNICKLSDERPPNGPEGGETLKNSLKKVKKGLDKLLRMC